MRRDLSDGTTIAATPVKSSRLFALFDAVVAWLLGVAFIFSSIPHLANPYFFLGSVYSYRLVGPGIAQLVAMLLPWLQLVVGMCLITNLLRGATHAIALPMLLIFVIVQTSAKLRGLDISCGCFGPRHETEVGYFTLTFVYALLLLALVRLLGNWWVTSRARQMHIE